MISESGLWWFVRIAIIISLNVNIRRYVCHSINIRDPITFIACEAIVNPSTGKIIDYLDESFMRANCGDCKEEVVITDVDRVKKDIDSMFFEFVKKNGKEPEYVECQIVWKDTGDDRGTTIKLSLSINDDDNDNVFYYCNGIESLKSLVEYGVGEFIVIDCWSFFSIDNL